jgi:hypothetical protein
METAGNTVSEIDLNCPVPLDNSILGSGDVMVFVDEVAEDGMPADPPGVEI